MAAITPDHRKLWREQWFDSLTEISALNYQRQTWGQTANPHDSYIEYTECYFGDLRTSDGYQSLVADGFLSFEEAFLVADLHLQLKEYRPAWEYDNAAILTDPAWLSIVSAARLARQRLLGLVTEPEERSILLHSEPQRP